MLNRVLFPSAYALLTANDNSYVARYFGKPGAGSALRTADGQPLAKLEGRVGTYAIHHDGPVGELVSYMGRVGPGGAPCRSNSGTIHAEHKSDVDLDRHHHVRQQGAIFWNLAAPV